MCFYNLSSDNDDLSNDEFLSRYLYLYEAMPQLIKASLGNSESVQDLRASIRELVSSNVFSSFFSSSHIDKKVEMVVKAIEAWRLKHEHKPELASFFQCLNAMEQSDIHHCLEQQLDSQVLNIISQEQFCLIFKAEYLKHQQKKHIALHVQQTKDYFAPQILVSALDDYLKSAYQAWFQVAQKSSALYQELLCRLAIALLSGQKEEQSQYMQLIFQEMNQQAYAMLNDFNEFSSLLLPMASQLDLKNPHTYAYVSNIPALLMQQDSIFTLPSQVEYLRKSIHDFTDAYQFFQYCGVATNDNLIAMITNAFSAYRHKDAVQKSKKKLQSIFSLFAPLAKEYDELSEETSEVRKAFRFFLPILFASALVLAVTLLCSPIGTQGIGIGLLCVLTFAIGLVIASGLLHLKNEAYCALRKSYFGGEYKLPEYQVNQRMIQAFTEPNARKIKNLYIASLTHCDEQMKAINTTLKKGGQMTRKEADRLDALKKEKQQLQAEWYDMRKNPKLHLEDIIEVAAKRLMILAKKEKKNIQNLLLLKERARGECFFIDCTEVKARRKNLSKLNSLYLSLREHGSYLKEDNNNEIERSLLNVL